MGTVKLLINNGRATVKTDSNGIFTYNYLVTRVGIINISATYQGSTKYTVSTASSIINVEKTGTKIVLNEVGTVKQKSKVDITCQLCDENDKGIYGTVKLLINSGRATVKQMIMDCSRIHLMLPGLVKTLLKQIILKVQIMKQVNH